MMWYESYFQKFINDGWFKYKPEPEEIISNNLVYNVFNWMGIKIDLIYDRDGWIREVKIYSENGEVIDTNNIDGLQYLFYLFKLYPEYMNEWQLYDLYEELIDCLKYNYEVEN